MKKISAYLRVVTLGIPTMSSKVLAFLARMVVVTLIKLIPRSKAPAKPRLPSRRTETQAVGAKQRLSSDYQTGFLKRDGDRLERPVNFQQRNGDSVMIKSQRTGNTGSAHPHVSLSTAKAFMIITCCCDDLISFFFFLNGSRRWCQWGGSIGGAFRVFYLVL